MTQAYCDAVRALEKATGVVIPAFCPKRAPADIYAAMLRDTALAFARELRHPEAVCVCADGPGPAAEAARSLAGETGVQAVVTERNLGKLSAVRAGMRALLGDARLRYLAAADQDGDHFANELLNFLRAARHAEAATGADDLLILGRRISRHRPMGYLRGELEELADRVLLDALHYHAAVTGRPLAMEFATVLEEFPDFHSGYKLFTRRAAERLFLSDQDFAGRPEECASRYAVEAVLAVEAIAGGGRLVTVNRSTFDEQPVSAFAELDRRKMVAEKIIWPCRRLNVPGPFVAQWMANHLARLQLGTLVPEGRDELLEIRRLVCEAFGVKAPQGILRGAFV